MKSGKPGTELKRLIEERYGIKPTDDCACKNRATVMDALGCDWCRDNVDIIVRWLVQGAKQDTLLWSLTTMFKRFAEKAARELVEEAINRACGS